MHRKTVGTNGTDCMVIVGSNTAAIRAEKVLRSIGIEARVRKSEGGGSSGGCSYGVSYPCLYRESVSAILRNTGIPVREYGDGN